MSHGNGKKHIVRKDKTGRLYVRYKPSGFPSRIFYAPDNTIAEYGMDVYIPRMSHISGVEFRSPLYIKTKKVRAAFVIPRVPNGEYLLTEKWIEDWDGKQPIDRHAI